MKAVSAESTRSCDCDVTARAKAPVKQRSWIKFSSLRKRPLLRSDTLAALVYRQLTSQAQA